MVNKINYLITLQMSWYINLLRAVGSIIVFLDHAGMDFFSRGVFPERDISHEMVVLFFVLSGFLAANLLNKVNISVKSYFLARFSRISSVAYPALLLTVICDFVGRMFAPEFYDEIAQINHYWIRILLNFFFLAQAGPFAASPGSNPPFWYLNYQVWYYILFGICLLSCNLRRRLFLLILAAGVAGLKILALFPIFLAGILAYTFTSRFKLRPLFALLLVAATSLLIGLVLTGNAASWGYPAYFRLNQPLFWSTQYLSSNLLGIIFAVHLYSVDQLISRMQVKELSIFMALPVSFVSDRSFSLYLFHMPLLYLFSVAIPYDKSDPLQVASVALLTLILILIFYTFTERKRDVWRLAAQNSLEHIAIRFGH